MTFDWSHMDIVRVILSVSTTIPFLLFGSAGIWHFGGRHQSGTGLVTIASLLGFCATIYAIWLADRISLWSALGVAMHATSVFIFGWSVGTSGKKNLGLALNDSSSKKLITDGPYALVRHPFYTCYIVFWFGNVAIVFSPFTILPALALAILYFFTSRREDRVLAKLFEEEYPGWHANTGAFFPKWR